MPRRLKIKAAPALERLYHSLNRRFFSNRLPKTAIVAWGVHGRHEFRKGDLGQSYFLRSAEIFSADGKSEGTKKNVPVIEISTDYKNTKIVQWTMLHEMVHVKLRGSGAHASKFQAEMLRLAKAGAFKRIW